MSYFKIPVRKLIKELPPRYGMTEFNVSQQCMVDSLENNRFHVHVAARRTGKSIGAATLGLAKLLEPNQNVSIVSPDYSLSSIILDIIVDCIEHLALKPKKFNMKDRVIELENKSTLRLMSANNRTSLVGRGINFLIVDEAALIPDAGYYEQELRPSLTTFHDSRALFISTPRGTANYLYRYYLRGQNKNDAEWSSSIFDWTANPRLREEDILEAKSLMPEHIFMQEYYCSWVDFEGQVYKILDSHKVSTEDIEPGDRRFNFIGGLDVGYRDATAFVVIATNGKEYIVVDEFRMSGGTTSTYASHIKELIDKWDVENVYIDSAAQQTKADFAYEYDIFCENANKSVNDGIMFMQTLVEQNKFVISDTCPISYASMNGYRWNTKGTSSKTVHDEHSHMCDAIRYACYTWSKSQDLGIFTEQDYFESDESSDSGL